MPGFKLHSPYRKLGTDHADSEWMRQEYIKMRKTAQLLGFGACFAIVGLLLALGMMVFRNRCDPRYHEGMYVEDNGEMVMCKNHVDALIPKVLVVDVGHIPCQIDADCSEVKGGFCEGGEDGIFSKDFCMTGACSCKEFVRDCGLEANSELPFMPLNLVDGECTQPACNETVSVTIPSWSITTVQSWIGCSSRVKTDLDKVMKLVQHRLQAKMIRNPLRPSSDPVWSEVRKRLKETPDVHFNSFWPSTISESVAKGFSPESRMFIGFMICAALCLKISDYVGVCPTVDLPNRDVPIIGAQWNMLRTWLPPLGLILLAMVQMVPTSEIFGLNEVLMTLVHLTGAQFVFVVYLVCEAASLVDKENRSEMTGLEFRLRFALCGLGSMAMAAFGLFYMILMVFSGGLNTPYCSPPFDGKTDFYFRHRATAQAFLLRPAEGVWKMLKVLSYCSEYTVAMSILCSHLVICIYFKAHIEKRFKSEAELVAAGRQAESTCGRMRLPFPICA
eukprot:CAMPEP_0171125974 /NCGR_PEP_ID=MMETSP0766_2-20121228/112378_1 /TAXON_ID=439317 /ORGANISM="Gambierdiscus australes, Strain CAWD 149" /LENGTH=502 /DNA_ID=CAMNT_0011588975 /DNA_START=22 /DNA_END=1530 /DNA_ORIENTATION=+